MAEHQVSLGQQIRNEKRADRRAIDGALEHGADAEALNDEAALWSAKKLPIRKARIGPRRAIFPPEETSSG